VRRVHVSISGEVQGVFFRYETRQRARELGIAGWVRNTADGRVEAVFEGSDDAVDQMVAWCRQGPDQADVREVDVRDEDPEGIDTFEVLG
jgi:acylphosphatase